jgi:hemolysin III
MEQRPTELKNGGNNVTDDKEPRYTLGEEIANAVTHGLGAIVGVVALTLMVVYATLGGDPWRIVSVSIFGGTLILLYVASTLYHALPFQKTKRVFRVMDHCAIYFLIAGTYTPFLLVNMRGPWGWSLFGVLWGIAVAGCFYKIFCLGKWEILSTLAYIAMGWAAVVAFKPAVTMIPFPAIVLIAIGGIAYTAGTIFYAWDRLPYNHMIWHLFVLLGSTLHWIAVLLFVVSVSHS